jgi:hypothetical protein
MPVQGLPVQGWRNCTTTTRSYMKDRHEHEFASERLSISSILSIAALEKRYATGL